MCDAGYGGCLARATQWDWGLRTYSHTECALLDQATTLQTHKAVAVFRNVAGALHDG